MSPNRSIPDWKKAVIQGMSQKYGNRAIANKLDVSRNTVKKYANQEGELEMEGRNLKLKNDS